MMNTSEDIFLNRDQICEMAKEEFEEIFEKAMNHNGPVVIECVIDCDDKVFPMVAPGGAIEEAFDEKDFKNAKTVHAERPLASVMSVKWIGAVLNAMLMIFMFTSVKSRVL